MNQSADRVRELLLKQGGFIGRDGRRHTGLIDANDAEQHADRTLRYAALFREMETHPALPDLIYEIPGTGQAPGTPCIYVKAIEDPSPERIAALRTLLWNHGRIPTLWVVTLNSVRIYNAFARPRAEDKRDIASHLLAELHCIAEQIRGIEEFHRSKFDTGDFWRAGAGSSIDPRQRVDQALLRDLSDTEELLRSEGLPSSVAHALLGRTIFVKYLEDRGILSTSYFDIHGEFKNLLQDRASTYSFFDRLHQSFNGDLFPLSQAEQQTVEDRHLDILHRFLSGHVMGGYPYTQARLWPYSFKLIPIELVSSIYEMFAHAGDSLTAEALSIHYTRFGLVELVLSLSMRNMADTVRVFDPACGSGAFLVEAFRRLAWQRSRRLDRRLSREELQELLSTQIFGMDIDRDAIYVAAFSLYLALLEMDPHPRQAPLRLPQLLASNLHVQDFLNTEHQFNRTAPFVDGFDLIVSNPPWTALSERTAPRDPDDSMSGVKWGLVYTGRHKIPDRKPDQAFMRRARDFASSDSIVALIVGSRLFHQTSPSGERWRRTFLENNVVRCVVNLSDLVNEDLLFGWRSSTRLPASVVIFSPSRPVPDTLVQYITPKWYPGVRSRDEILLTSADIQMLPQQLLHDKPILWKSAFRGTPRDFPLLCRLQELHTLDDVLKVVGVQPKVHRGRGVTFGRGEQKDASHLRGIPFLMGDIRKRRYSLDASILPPFSRPTIAQRSNQVVLNLPALVMSRALLDYRPCVSLVERDAETKLVVSQSYYGISFPENLSWLAQRLNAVLNSDFSLYWAFMTSPALGVDRKLIEVSDWLGFPMPRTVHDQGSPIWTDIQELEQRLRQQTPLAQPVDREQLNELVYGVYDLSDQDTLLIRDTVRFTIDPFLKRARLFGWEPPSSDQLRTYARRMCTQLNGIFRHADRELSAVVCRFPQGAPLSASYFTLRGTDHSPLVTEIAYGDIEDVLAGMSEDLQAEVADNLYVHRDLRAYAGETFWIIKPAVGRLWSEAAALNDADTVVDEHMEAR